MRSTNEGIHRNTPLITSIDNRGLSVRTIAYRRLPGSPTATEVRTTRHNFDSRGHLTQSIDPRLYALKQSDARVKPNFSYLSSLTGNVTGTDSVDSGNAVTLNDSAGRPALAVNATGVMRTWQYEANTLAGHLLGITEQVNGQKPCITERFVWAGNSPAEQDLNLVGQCVCHYDTAGLSQTDSVALTGLPQSVTRQLLPDDAGADWQGNEESDWNDHLAPEVFVTKCTVDATGTVLTTTDAMGHVQRLAYDVTGLLKGSWLTLKGDAEQIVVKSLTYTATDQKLREEHGNGVLTTYTYEPQTQRLIGIRTERPLGHAGGAKVLQDLRYMYDPVGNVLRVTNDAEATRFWRNQKIVPENTCTYDSLYQLISATGRETVAIVPQNNSLPGLSAPLPADQNNFTNYTRHYTYDDGGNLIQICHSAPASNHNYTTRITVSNSSNRGVLDSLTADPAQVEKYFSIGGHQHQLQPGQHLVWTGRGELLQVTPVTRNGEPSDNERYRYDAHSQRVIKINMKKNAGSHQIQRVVYLPGLELRSTISGSTNKESQHVITLGEVGRAQVRMLHWESGKRDSARNDQIRYSYTNLVGSSGLEIDGAGNIISLEEYYPYGGTAVWTTRNQIEADYKTHRYSGKERDATGLYYYGYRYYQPWAGRWLSSDPMETVDGLNLYRMVRNNPLTFEDIDGRMIRRQPEDSPTENQTLVNHPSQENTLAPTPSSLPLLESLGTQPLTREPEKNSLPASIEKSMEQLQLEVGANGYNVISVSADIGDRDPIDGGGYGEIYESKDGRHVYKKYHNVKDAIKIPAYITPEESGFNTYYGSGSATAMIENGSAYLKMIKLDGIPLHKIKENTLPAHAADALRNAFHEMEKKDLYHQDIQGKNFLFSEKDNKIYPVDMEAHPYDIAQYTIRVYNSNKTKVLNEFSRLIKK
ncbi:insecticidal toxin complex protein TccC [Pseudomonas laurylsulfativorans]|uniref:RHS repeat domain-containing protein n=1 Tax=Pseudomonas laurylsulfativorans TaxID=1943631 RepID=UPI00209D5A96|nr:RHS repeat domain-containing protein [Pseudomonas laurylsulfativorans]MCP1420243.1 insecticidal toxin complex protein TccC [Pseudomonas laurylsulfativorans]